MELAQPLGILSTVRAASIIVRLVAAWIVVGASLKLLYGTPAGLPRAIQDLPLGLGITFRLVIALEFAIALLALIRPNRGWLPLCVLLGSFLGVLGTQVAAGASSCGCFGDAITISPGLMLGIDGVCLLAVLFARPWRVGATDPQLPWVLYFVLLAGTVCLPWVYNREAGSTEQITTGRGYTDLETENYEGKRFTDTILAGLLPNELLFDEAIYVIWNPTCEVCADHLSNLRETESFGQREVVLIRNIMGGENPPDDEVKVHVFPEGEWVHRYDLPLTKDWLSEAPTHIEVKDGKVAVCAHGMDALGK